VSSFITVGNLHNDFQRMSSTVEACFHLLPRPIIIQHGYTRFSSRILKDPAVIAFPFCARQQFENYVRAAHLLLAHGGAGTLMEGLEQGLRPGVFVRSGSMEHIDDHQVEFCRKLQDRGLITIIESDSSLRDYLRCPDSWKGEPVQIRDGSLAADVQSYLRSVVRESTRSDLLKPKV
jgi:UDP-N-acetylglucosamine transferase subunit ALG13